MVNRGCGQNHQKSQMNFLYYIVMVLYDSHWSPPFTFIETKRALQTLFIFGYTIGYFRLFF